MSWVPLNNLECHWFVVFAVRVASDPQVEIPQLGFKAVFRGPEGQVAPVDREVRISGFAWEEGDFFKAFQLFHGACYRSGKVLDVKLRDGGSLPRSGVSNRNGRCDRFHEVRGGEGDWREFKFRVGQAKSKRVGWRVVDIHVAG